MVHLYYRRIAFYQLKGDFFFLKKKAVDNKVQYAP